MSMCLTCGKVSAPSDYHDCPELIWHRLAALMLFISIVFAFAVFLWRYG